MAGADVGRDIRSRLSDYTPGSFRSIEGHRFTKVCIQLFGMTGHGKSSLINSCACVMLDRAYSNVTGALVSTDSAPDTMKRKEYRLSDSVYITDNRGLVILNQEELYETTAQMTKLRTLGPVKWGGILREGSDVFFDNFRNPPTEIMLPVFVYSIKADWTSRRSEEIKPFLKRAFQVTDIFPVIVLTRCSSPKTQDIREHFRSLDANFVFPIENYTSTDNVRTPEKDWDILKFLEVCLMETDRSISLKMHRDPREQILQHFVTGVKGEMEDKDKEIEELMKKLKNKQGWWYWIKSKFGLA